MNKEYIKPEVEFMALIAEEKITDGVLGGETDVESASGMGW